MARDRPSLLAGRNLNPLSEKEATRAVNTFLGLDAKVNVRFDPTRGRAFTFAKRTGRSMEKSYLDPISILDGA